MAEGKTGRVKRAIASGQEKLFLSLICLFIVIGLFVAGLWPLEFNPRNGITRSKDRVGIRFDGRGMAYCPEPLFGPQQRMRDGAPIVIEFAVRPISGNDSHVGRILSFHDPHGTEIFFIGQWKHELIIRSLDPRRRSPDPYLEIGADKTLTGIATRFVTVTSGMEGTAIYVDGRKISSFPGFSLVPKGFDRPLHLLLGDAPGGHEGWTGEISALSIFDRPVADDEIMRRYANRADNGKTGTSSADNAPIISFGFDERTGYVAHNQGDPRFDLVIPPTFRVLHKQILGFPSTTLAFNRSFVSDVAINIFGFVPAGFFFLAWFRNRESPLAIPPAAYSILICGSISLAIELIQVHLPTRDSSALDLACNVMGSVIGVFATKKRGEA